MDELLLFAALVVFYACLPIGFAALRSPMRLTLLYVNVSIVLVVDGFLGAVYQFELAEGVTVSGGSIAYCALMLTAILLVIVGNDLQVVRNVIKIVFAVSLFNLGLFHLNVLALQSDDVVSPSDVAPAVFSTSLRVVVVGGALVITELLLLIALFERVKSRVESPKILAGSYVVLFIAVLCLDGVLFPLLASSDYSDIGGVIGRGVKAKLLLSVSFSLPLIAFLAAFRETRQEYEARPIRLIGLFRPRTALMREIARQQEVLEHQAFHDRLTGLANRALLVQRIEEALVVRDGARRSGVAVLFLDLDDFKTINDGHGHRVGDQVLLAVGRRIEESVPGGTAARIGGDEFAVLLDDATTAAAIEAAGARMLDRIREPLTVGAEPVTVRASMGIALADRLGDVRAEELIHNADLAMYRAKASGKGRLMLYEASMHRAVIERATLIAEIRTGLARHEFVMHYQPIVELTTGRVIAVEALVRWQHPKHGLLPPGAFIGLAEESDLIVTLGTGALRDACRDVQSWHDRRFRTALGDPILTDRRPPSVFPPDVPIGVTVNLSTRQFQEPTLVDEVMSALQTSGLPPQRLTLEITESNFMSDVEGAIETLGMLKALGVHISVDDFGTGFSSLSYLQRLPVDALKIDMSFIDRIATGGTEDVALVRTVIALGASLNLLVIAEGIEEVEQRDILVDLGCPLGQGYHFGRPISREETERLLEPAPRRADHLIDQP